MFWVKFCVREPAVLVPLALLAGAVVLLMKRGGWPAILQIIGCLAFLTYFWLQMFVAMTDSQGATFINGTPPQATQPSSLLSIKQTFGGLTLLFPVGFIWFVVRVTRRI